MMKKKIEVECHLTITYPSGAQSEAWGWAENLSGAQGAEIRTGDSTAELVQLAADRCLTNHLDGAELDQARWIQRNSDEAA